MLSLDKFVSNFYFHIPFCIKKCYFCAFPVHAVGEKTDPSQKQKSYGQYCEKIEHQIKTVLNHSPQLCNNIQSLYFGGGTPSLLSGSQIRSILKHFKYGITNKTEITLEMNIQELRKVEQFLNQGINRISIGVQSVNKRTLDLLNRGYFSPDSTPQQQIKKRLCELSKSTNLNLDFIIDLNSSKKEMDELVSLVNEVKPKHLSLYMLQINEGSYLHRNQKLFTNKLGTPDNYEELSHILSSGLGYEHYEVSNFCIPGFSSIHNSAYWLGNKPFGAFGMGATSLLNNFRISRPRNLSKYYSYVKRLDHDLNPNPEIVQIHPEKEGKQQLKWVIMSRLRRREGLTWCQLRQYLTVSEEEQIIQKMKNQMQTIHKEMQGIVDLSQIETGVKLSIPRGYLFVDQISYRILECLQI